MQKRHEEALNELKERLQALENRGKVLVAGNTSGHFRTNYIYDKSKTPAGANSKKIANRVFSVRYESAGYHLSRLAQTESLVDCL